MKLYIVRINVNGKGTCNRDHPNKAQNKTIRKSILLENMKHCLDDTEDVKFDWTE